MRWKKDDSLLGFSCEGDLPCPICGNSLTLHFATTTYPEHTMEGQVCRMFWGCLDCGLKLKFDVPISGEYASELRKRWGASELCAWDDREEHSSQEMEEVYSSDEIDEIKKRIKQLGYF